MVVGVLCCSVVFLVTVGEILTGIDLIPPNPLPKHILPDLNHERKPPHDIFLQHPRILHPNHIPFNPSILFLIFTPALLHIIPDLEINALFPLTAATATCYTFIRDI